jgi:hypothetical protein
MFGVGGLALLFAIVIGMLGFAQIVDLQASFTTATGGLATFIDDLPTIFMILFVGGIVAGILIALVGKLQRI